ncbi:MAG: UbiA-like polyprenyltransferase [Phycisphaerae bacterium]
MTTNRSWLQSVAVWADMVKFGHSIFALPFALIATFLAARHLEGSGLPQWGHVGLIVWCMVAARSTAMTFNRIVDAQIDARNPRTASRPIPAGKISMSAAWFMLGLSGITFGLGCLGFFVYYGNTWPMLLSGPVLLFLCGYSLTKRFTAFSHFYLGSTIAFSPVAAWLAIDPGSIGWTAVTLLITVACWIGGFDIIYACQDIDVDRNEGLYSLPSRLGPHRALWIARVAHTVTAAGLIMIGQLEQLGMIYHAGVAITIVLLIVENALVKPNDYRHVTLAFFTLNGVISVVLAVAAIADASLIA